MYRVSPRPSLVSVPMRTKRVKHSIYLAGLLILVTALMVLCAAHAAHIQRVLIQQSYPWEGGRIEPVNLAIGYEQEVSEGGRRRPVDNKTPLVPIRKAEKANESELVMTDRADTDKIGFLRMPSSKRLGNAVNLIRFVVEEDLTFVAFIPSTTKPTNSTAIVGDFPSVWEALAFVGRTKAATSTHRSVGFAHYECKEPSSSDLTLCEDGFPKPRLFVENGRLFQPEYDGDNSINSLINYLVDARLWLNFPSSKLLQNEIELIHFVANNDLAFVAFVYPSSDAFTSAWDSLSFMGATKGDTNATEVAFAHYECKKMSSLDLCDGAPTPRLFRRGVLVQPQYGGDGSVDSLVDYMAKLTNVFDGSKSGDEDGEG